MLTVLLGRKMLVISGLWMCLEQGMATGKGNGTGSSIGIGNGNGRTAQEGPSQPPFLQPRPSVACNL